MRRFSLDEIFLKYSKLSLDPINIQDSLVLFCGTNKIKKPKIKRRNIDLRREIINISLFKKLVKSKIKLSKLKDEKVKTKVLIIYMYKVLFLFDLIK